MAPARYFVTGSRVASVRPVEHGRSITITDGVHADTGMATYLPSAYRHRYDLLFAKRFLACIYTVAWKL
jgi:hypothetical protein